MNIGSVMRLKREAERMARPPEADLRELWWGPVILRQRADAGEDVSAERAAYKKRLAETPTPPGDNWLRRMREGHPERLQPREG